MELPTALRAFLRAALLMAADALLPSLLPGDPCCVDLPPPAVLPPEPITRRLTGGRGNCLDSSLDSRGHAQPVTPH